MSDRQKSGGIAFQIKDYRTELVASRMPPVHKGVVKGPEDIARETIDQLLVAAGWVVQDRDQFDRNAGLGVAVREFHLPAGPCDYLLFVDGKAAGVIEAKKTGVTLSGVAEQSDKYMQRLPEHMHARWDDILVYDYESTGDESFFRNMRDPKPRSRRLFAFHQPATLREWLVQPNTLRDRLRTMPPLIKTSLRDCQVEAIEGLERSLAEDKPRSLIQLATGAGKTFTACSFSYRLIKEAGAKRILFLVDRNNLGDQTLKEFQNFHPPGSANRFTDTYIVQHLNSHRLDNDAKVVITTIQRLYSMLRGKDLDVEDEEESAFEKWGGDEAEQPPIGYNPDIPIETFDFIVTDECHRSIYGLWRQVLEYFDAYIIGLTATPSKHTLGFFNQNLVAEYPYERSVVDGVNVGYEVYRIRTRITEQGATLEGKPGFPIPFRDKRTRKIRYEELDADLEYTAKDLDRSVVNPNQIRTVLETYKERVFTELFPGRTGEWLPKTLIFAKDDAHAEEIVHQVREVFGEGNDFAKKITYRNTGESPKELIKAFRVDPFPRVAVTVDMIATGTDIKPVEVLIFMRDVKSESYYEQMKGRGVRTIPDADLKAVTPDAQTKTRFILIDAVGVSETKKNASQPLERKKGVSFEALLEQIAMGRRDEDAMSSLAARLAALDRKLADEDRQRIAEATSGKTPRDLANALLDAIDPDKRAEAIAAEYGTMATPAQEDAVLQQLAETACAPFDKPAVRNLLKDIKAKMDIVIDEITIDEVLSADFDLKRSEETITSFKQFIEDNRDELTALQILYNQPLGRQRLTYAAVRELVNAMHDKPPYLTTANVWQAYKRLDAKVVHGAPVDEQLTEVVSLVRFALGQMDALEPFGSVVEQRFNLWLGREKKAGRDYTPEHEEWLRMIASFIAANAEITPRDFQDTPSLSDKGGILKARKLFEPRFNETLDELQTALVA